MKWKYMRLFLSISCCLFLVLSIYIFPINIIKASEFNPNDYITFGVYSTSENGIVESTSVRFDEHVIYGLTLGIYNYYVGLYGNQSTFPEDFTTIRTRLYNLLGDEFWSNVVNYRFLCNCYRFRDYYNNECLVFAFNRASFDNGKVFERSVNISDLVTFEILPEAYNGGKYLLVNVTSNNTDRYRLFNVLPYFNRNDLGVADTNYLNSSKTEFSLSDITQSMVSQTTRSFIITVKVSTPAITFELETGHNRINAYVNDETFSGMCNFSNMSNIVPIMSDFPIYTYDFMQYNNSNAFLYFNDANALNVRLYYNRLPNVYWWEDMSPVLITDYQNIPNVTPTPTFTPTPIPTRTPYPTATPFPPVNEIEGISQMMSLFTRKYDFNINGNVIGIRPLYLFVFTFLVGAIFKAIQGGDRN